MHLKLCKYLHTKPHRFALFILVYSKRVIKSRLHEVVTNVMTACVKFSGAGFILFKFTANTLRHSDSYTKVHQNLLFEAWLY